MLARATVVLCALLLLLPATGLAVVHDISITGFDFVPGNQTIIRGIRSAGPTTTHSLIQAPVITESGIQARCSVGNLSPSLSPIPEPTPIIAPFTFP